MFFEQLNQSVAHAHQLVDARQFTFTVPDEEMINELGLLITELDVPPPPPEKPKKMQRPQSAATASLKDDAGQSIIGFTGLAHHILPSSASFLLNCVLQLGGDPNQPQASAPRKEEPGGEDGEKSTNLSDEEEVRRTVILDYILCGSPEQPSSDSLSIGEYLLRAEAKLKKEAVAKKSDANKQARLYRDPYSRLGSADIPAAAIEEEAANQLREDASVFHPLAALFPLWFSGGAHGWLGRMMCHVACRTGMVSGLQAGGGGMRLGGDKSSEKIKATLSTFATRVLEPMLVHLVLFSVFPLARESQDVRQFQTIVEEAAADHHGAKQTEDEDDEPDYFPFFPDPTAPEGARRFKRSQQLWYNALRRKLLQHWPNKETFSYQAAYDSPIVPDIFSERKKLYDNKAREEVDSAVEKFVGEGERDEDEFELADTDDPLPLTMVWIVLRLHQMGFAGTPLLLEGDDEVALKDKHEARERCRMGTAKALLLEDDEDENEGEATQKQQQDLTTFQQVSQVTEITSLLRSLGLIATLANIHDSYLLHAAVAATEEVVEIAMLQLTLPASLKCTTKKNVTVADLNKVPKELIGAAGAALSSLLREQRLGLVQCGYSVINVSVRQLVRKVCSLSLSTEDMLPVKELFGVPVTAALLDGNPTLLTEETLSTALAALFDYATTIMSPISTPSPDTDSEFVTQRSRSLRYVALESMVKLLDHEASVTLTAAMDDATTTEEQRQSIEQEVTEALLMKLSGQQALPLSSNDAERQQWCDKILTSELSHRAALKLRETGQFTGVTEGTGGLPPFWLQLLEVCFELLVSMTSIMYSAGPSGRGQSSSGCSVLSTEGWWCRQLILKEIVPRAPLHNSAIHSHWILTSLRRILLSWDCTSRGLIAANVSAEREHCSHAVGVVALLTASLRRLQASQEADSNASSMAFLAAQLAELGDDQTTFSLNFKKILVTHVLPQVATSIAWLAGALAVATPEHPLNEASLVELNNALVEIVRLCFACLRSMRSHAELSVKEKEIESIQKAVAELIQLAMSGTAPPAFAYRVAQQQGIPCS